MDTQPGPDPERRNADGEGGIVDWQFQLDPEGWTRLLFTGDAEERARRYRTIGDALLGEALHFGLTGDPALVNGLSGFYAWCLKHGMSVEIRRAVYRHAAGHQQCSKVITAHAYVPFMCCDPDIGVCCTAAIDFVSTAPLTDGDPMSRVKDVIEVIVCQRADNVGAVFGALLHLGDPRVCALLAPLRDGLTDFEANEAVRCFTGAVHAATTEFLLDWLEGLEGDGQDRRFGIVASGLLLLRRGMQGPLVSTGERPFPLASVTPEEDRRMGRYIPIEEYTQRITPRLRALERTEPEPKVMPQVLEVWGLAPLGREETGAWKH